MEISNNGVKLELKFSFDQYDLDGLIGKHFFYKYDNGWKYEIYVKNSNAVDYRIHGGPCKNRWVKNQRVTTVRIARAMYKTSWTEPTGTDVSLVFNLDEPFIHGSVFFPRWVADHPEKTTVFQNDVVAQMEEYREAGPAYPTEVINVFGSIFHLSDRGPDDESVISCSPKDLPEDFFHKLKSKD